MHVQECFKKEHFIFPTVAQYLLPCKKAEPSLCSPPGQVNENVTENLQRDSLCAISSLMPAKISHQKHASKDQGPDPAPW